VATDSIAGKLSVVEDFDLHLVGDVQRQAEAVIARPEVGRRCRDLDNDPPAHELPAYVDKYTWGFERNHWTAEQFAADYSVPIRIRLGRIRGH